VSELPLAFIDRIAASLSGRNWRTRFAPAPTGYLHLGHLVNAIHVWGIARAYGGRVSVRIEDHDRTRCKPEYEQALLEDLEWLGLDADLAPRASVLHPRVQRQSDQGARYSQALDQLDVRGLVYPCHCTRRDIAQLVPRAPGEEARYPGTCRAAPVDGTTTFARRVTMLPGEEAFDDLRLGRLTQAPAAQCGDVLVRDRHANWTYQFAVTVDDFIDEIDVIIRGMDLLTSTGRQWRLARMLGRTTMPITLHHDLLHRADGAKLSKASGDTALRELREAGATAAQLLGEAAYRVGLQKTPRSIQAADLAALFV
jgi:glutamyl-tRNA synthetase/glutamyl-Q tRNA(Asp) synthetase